VPENLTGQIRAFGPSHLILIDAADMGLPPGSVELLETKDILNTASFSTHSLPLSVLSDYLGRMLECQVLLIGIQPATREFNRDMTPAVVQGARAAARIIWESLPVSN
jgi:hydrogenase 3 maturation protease